MNINLESQELRIIKGDIHMEIKRVWAMPNSRTFSIKPINELIHKYKRIVNADGVIIDPFANKNKLASITNDLDESYDTDYHLDATDFLKMFNAESVDMVLYDPPYSPRQVSECYKKLGHTVDMKTTQASYWSQQKKEIARIVKPRWVCSNLWMEQWWNWYKVWF